MNAKEINQISIVEYLKTLSIYPSKKMNGYYMYFSPFRSEKTPSLKVCEIKNLWCDFGAPNCEGGSLIDLVLKFYPNITVKEVIAHLSKLHLNSFPIEITNESTTIAKKLNESSIKILEVRDLNPRSLLGNYLKNRSIKPSIYSKYVKTIYYEINNRKFFAIGFPNKLGWVLRNAMYKGCTHQTYSYFENGNTKLMVFEGFMDFLSCLQIYKDRRIGYDYIILNSNINIHKAKNHFVAYCVVELWLDNDESGDNATKEITSEKIVKQTIIDKRSSYNDYKDLNEYLMFYSRGVTLSRIIQEIIEKRSDTGGENIFSASQNPKFKN